MAGKKVSCGPGMYYRESKRTAGSSVARGRAAKYVKE
jgi:hypothetical protein